jgi:tRNA-(ms[2]io[6]A)-hydroxylase
MAMAEIEQLPLLVATPAAWVELVLADFGTFLLDHACCERKAAASALSFLARNSEHPSVVETMVTLAREELDHFAQVHRLVQKRGLVLGGDSKDLYVNHLLTAVRNSPNERLLDRLLISALIEARSSERFYLLAERLPSSVEHELAPFYHMLYRSEAGHYRVFLRLAERLFPVAEVALRWQHLLRFEVEAMQSTPLRAAMH